MNKAGKILSISPPNAIPGGEITIGCENLIVPSAAEFRCFIGGQTARITAASANRVIAIVPDEAATGEVEVYFEIEGERSAAAKISVGRKLADNLHIVANPAVNPFNDTIIVTRSGSRGQQISPSLFRLETDDYLSEIYAEVLNPTAVAFDRNGKLFITARADGEVLQLLNEDETETYASELGVATGLAFDKNGVMFVGDRNGAIYRVENSLITETLAVLEPSVSAFHLAFGADEKLYVTAPGLASFDAIYRIDRDGTTETFFRGLGRPQGIAFDAAGNLYAAACRHGRHGIVKIEPNGKTAEIFVAGMNVVGLCFTRQGEMIVATGEAVYSLSLDIRGILPNDI